MGIVTQIDSGSNNLQLFSSLLSNNLLFSSLLFLSLSKKIDTDLKAISTTTTTTTMALGIWILLKSEADLAIDAENGEWKAPEYGDDDEGSEWRQLWDPQNRILAFSDVDECPMCGKEIPWYAEERDKDEPEKFCSCESGLWENQETEEKCLVPLI